MLAFFGKSEKVLAPRKKKRERERERERTESMVILVNGALWKIAGQRMDDRDFG